MMIITRIHRLKRKQEPHCLTGNEGNQAVYDAQQGAAAWHHFHLLCSQI